MTISPSPPYLSFPSLPHGICLSFLSQHRTACRRDHSLHPSHRPRLLRAFRAHYTPFPTWKHTHTFITKVANPRDALRAKSLSQQSTISNIEPTLLHYAIALNHLSGSLCARHICFGSNSTSIGIQIALHILLNPLCDSTSAFQYC